MAWLTGRLPLSVRARGAVDIGRALVAAAIALAVLVEPKLVPALLAVLEALRPSGSLSSSQALPPSLDLPQTGL
jgi:hypothetical protein